MSRDNVMWLRFAWHAVSFSVAAVAGFGLCVGIGWVLAACSLDTGKTTPDGMRIVSFMPSATRIVVDLGLGDQLVGVAEHDAAAPARNADGDAMPIVGNYMAVDVERLISLRPTHVIFPETAGGVPGDATLGVEAVWVRLAYPETLEAVWDSIREVGQALGADSRAEVLMQDWSSGFLSQGLDVSNLRVREMIFSGEMQLPVRRVLLVFSVDPVVASGPGSVNDELLRFAGATNAVGDAAVSAVTLDREALIEVNPEVIVLLLPGADEAEVADKVAWFDDLPIAAVAAGRVHALTDSQVLLPSTNLPGVLEELVGVIWGSDPSGAVPPRTSGEATVAW